MRYAILVIVCAAVLGISTNSALAVRPRAELSWDSDGAVENLSVVSKDVTDLHVTLTDVHDIEKVSFEVVWSLWGTCFPGYPLLSSPVMAGCGWFGEDKAGTVLKQDGTSWTIELEAPSGQADRIYLAYAMSELTPAMEGTFCLKSFTVTDSKGNKHRLDTPNVATVKGHTPRRQTQAFRDRQPGADASSSGKAPTPLAEPPRKHTNALLKNYPSPFRRGSGTTIHYTAAKSGTAEIRIFDAVGRLIRTLEVEAHPGDNFIAWDGSAENGRHVASGVYFYELKMDGFRAHRKTVLLK
jgi:hypothetical protein